MSAMSYSDFAELMSMAKKAYESVDDVAESLRDIREVVINAQDSKIEVSRADWYHLLECVDKGIVGPKPCPVCNGIIQHHDSCMR